MGYETETKVLGVDKEAVAKALKSIGASKVLDTRYSVDWFRVKGVKEGEDLWYLRIRRKSNGPAEVTWKGKSDKLGVSRKHKEINFSIAEPDELAALFAELGLELYAHQDKDRISWTYKDWRFDLDQYPGMDAYLEIEGISETHIQEAIQMLNLNDHETSAEGERVLIQKKYGLDWYSMRF